MGEIGRKMEGGVAELYYRHHRECLWRTVELVILLSKSSLVWHCLAHKSVYQPWRCWFMILD